MFANRTDPDQTTPKGAVWSGSALYANWNIADKCLNYYKYTLYVHADVVYVACLKKIFCVNKF